MGRTERNLTRLRVELGAAPTAGQLQGTAPKLRAIADAVPQADQAAAPLLRDLAMWAAGVRDGDDVDRFTSALDALIDYAGGRDHPDRAGILGAVMEMVASSAEPEPTVEPAASRCDGLPATFVGDLPPRSTLDDAALLLVQLEPGDSYGVRSLLEILEGLADDAGSARGTREALSAAAGLLSAGPVTAETLDTVGRALERLSEGDTGAPGGPAASAASSTLDPEEPHRPAAEADTATVPGPWTPGPDADVELLTEFLAESRDLLASAEEALLALEADPGDSEAINVVFRAFHTIKGTSAFLGVEQSSVVCHHAESLFSRVRDGDVSFDRAVADVSLRAVDVLSAVLASAGEALDGGTPTAVPGIAALVEALQAGGRGTRASGERRAEADPPAAARADAAAEPLSGDVPDPSVDDAAAAGAGASMTPRARGRETGAGSPDASVRVRTDRLDRLVDMVGELVIAQSMIAQDGVVHDGTQHELAKKVGHAGKIVRELQDLSMALRMVPLRATFSKLQRLVRDLARKSGKRVQLMTEGEDTEIDRTMVDVLGDPLVHMIRNAVDHGIEAPADRVSAGKPEVGTLWVRSYHAGGNVVVELEDDGRGMNRARIVEKALERGLIRSSEGLSDGEVWKLVFEPGFSTAARVTEVSGRGVGMDVVRRNIETLRGRVEVESTEGAGTKITLRLPLTLAITEGMLMRVGRERYILPTLSIERNVRPTADMLSTVTGRGEMLMLRDELVPVVRLHALFGVESARHALHDGLLVVIGAAERRCALFVDELLGQQQVVVKSLGEGLGKVEGVTGGAVLGDGTVGLILDPVELVNLARRGAIPARAA